jgi:hypothetical protein
MQFYCLNMFRVPICPSSGVQLITSAFRWPYLESSSLGCAALGAWECDPARRVGPQPPSSYPLLEAQRCTTQVAFQLWPPKSGSYLLIVLLMMGILVPETCCGNKTAYFVASSWFFTFHIQTIAQNI